mgnify:CR=1 FL=1
MCAVQDVIKRMMVGAKTAVRTELTAQLEEQGYIEQVMALLKEKNFFCSSYCFDFNVNWFCLKRAP